MTQNSDTSRAALERLVRESTTTDVRTAAPFLGMGTATGYEAIQQGTWPTRVLRLGRKIRIPTADLGRYLGLDLVAEAPSAGLEDVLADSSVREGTTV